MAFKGENLGQLANAVSNSVNRPFALWRYWTDDDPFSGVGSVTETGYFLEAGVNDSGDNRLRNGDVIFVRATGGDDGIIVVNDTANGSATQVLAGPA